jgi:hypothetical protein
MRRNGLESCTAYWDYCANAFMCNRVADNLSWIMKLREKTEEELGKVVLSESNYFSVFSYRFFYFLVFSTKNAEVKNSYDYTDEAGEGRQKVCSLWTAVEATETNIFSGLGFPKIR